MSNAYLGYALIAIVAGVAVPLLASINASFGQAIGDVLLASMVLCCVAFAAILAMSLLTDGGPTIGALGNARWWHFAAGLFFMVYVVSITFVAPKIGLANAIIFVVVAQLFTAVIIDHFGLLGAAVQTLDWKRGLGVVCLVVGVALARSQSGASDTG